MTNSGWKRGALYSDKHGRNVDVEYQCEAELGGKVTIWIRPRAPDAADPIHEPGFQATFLRDEDGFTRATMLDRNGFRSLEGVTHDLLVQMRAHTRRPVRSSVMLRAGEAATDRDDQLQDAGIAIWRRFEASDRACFDADLRRFILK